MKKTTILLSFGILTVLASIFTSCSSAEEVEKLSLIQKIEITNEDTTDGSQKFTGDAHGGKYFSRTDSAAGQYGSTAMFYVPDSLLQKSIRVKVNMWVKQGAYSEHNKFAVSLQDEAGIVNWQSIDFKNYITENNKWINVIDSVTFPQENINKNGLFIKLFPYNPETKGFLDVDDEQIFIYKVEKVLVD